MEIKLTDVHEVIQKPVHPSDAFPASALTDNWPFQAWSKLQTVIIQKFGDSPSLEILGGKDEEGKMVLVIGNRL